MLIAVTFVCLLPYV